MKAYFLFIAIILGFLFPQGYILSKYIKHILILILFLTFIDIKVTKDLFYNKKLFSLVFLMLLLSILAYKLIEKYDKSFALIVFMVLSMPSAVNSPTLVRTINGKVDESVSALFISNFTVAIFLPFIISLILKINLKASMFTASLLGLKIILIAFFAAIFF